MRKCLLALSALIASVTLVIAGEVTFMGYDKEKKEVMVKDGDTEKTYKVTDKTTFKQGDKDVPSERAMVRLEKANDNEKQKGKMKFEITVDGSDLKEIKFKEGKKKADK